MKIIITLAITIVLSTNSFAIDSSIENFCKTLSKKLRTVKLDGCKSFNLTTMGKISTLGNPLTHREILPNEDVSPKGKILFLGGVHGDEYASISLAYLWLQKLIEPENPSPFHWLFLPVVNPDGLFQSPATRANGNSVDLNRNFPSPDWEDKAISTWKTHYNSDKRRYPGAYPNSEVETQWMVDIIERFQPDAIISIHAPFGLLDYDGPEHALPNKIGHLKHRSLGTYPGSLGRYAGEHLKIPVLTLELNSAGRMPNDKNIKVMLKDLEQWVEDKIKQKCIDM